MNKKVEGLTKETEAANYLSEQGYQILARNYRCRLGEIDIVARENGYLVFVEVKYRTNVEKGFPEEAITIQKQRRITNTAKYYLLVNRLPESTPCRFDVVVMLKEEIRLIKNAFDAYGS
ncbi:YraN family protein [Lachnoclostridium phytofermentans]|uniref:UPF0102 protein Cphy_2398 n=1 Tax=Lachnoclostridium phytofermentans (strain ATCC 700394 / DSM 18823 / ISDg) TaxID=357809 RepID=Y2398_LACP7|nr:YraN family protein [Lachnoclostridium phytofermentans]A9KLL5.1 RecName: Full=UPF0102 protein Cphy_2398 [Lachnoclostridium phytofermentans ISDg]ABX42759.1 protein of unknown function UPF0102 [Lachnoclostridium phytofermentans ISDg]